MRPPCSSVAAAFFALIVVLGVATPAGAARELQAKAPKELIKKYGFPQKLYLDQLPGAAILNPKGEVPAISITMVPATFTGPTNGPKLFTYTGMAYVDDNTGIAGMFGPTMRLKRGSPYIIKLTNALVQPTQHEEVNWIHNYGNTNMHTHGIHAELGVPSQSTAHTYTFGDNPFFTIKARNSTAYPPVFRIFNLKLPTNHMPGLHWYHPHQHGSTALQVGTAHGLIVVEDDNDFWMPPGTGCDQFRSIVENAQEVILDIQLFFFKNPTPKSVAPLPAYSKKIDLINNGPYQYVSDISLPKNRYGTGSNKASGKATSANGGRGINVLLVNGGYQPIVTMPSGVWQRWRILFSGIKGFFVMSIFDEATKQATNACEMMLYAKDGVYVMNLPRKIDAVFLASANRAEVLVRCSGTPGQKFVATSRSCQPFSTDCFGYKGDQVPADRINHIGPMFQDVIWTIQITAPPVLPPLSPLMLPIAERACTPRRASYAADVRNPALVKAGFDPANVYSYGVGFGGINLNDTLNPPEAYFYACAYNNGSEKALGTRFEFPDPEPLVLELGKIVQWEFYDLDFHPMHIHINPYQIQELNDTWLFKGSSWTPYFEVGDWHDTLTLPMIDLTAGVHVPLRFQPGQYSGYTVTHCHFLHHEDVGCMKVVLFKCPTLTEDNQGGPCPNFKFPVPGTVPDVFD